MDVSDILRDRMHEPGGLDKMIAVSIAAHAGFIALALLGPGNWFSRPVEEPKTVMTITLGGGAPGPQSGGMTSIGGRAVQTAEPPENPKVREAVRPPAAKAPEMTLPEKTKIVKSVKPTPKITESTEDARGRTPTRGEKIQSGSAVADTAARGQGFGLSTGGGAGSGSYLDVGNFCCPDYISTMVQRIQANWNPQAEVAGETMIKFTIQRDGRLTDITLERSSGYTALDLTAQRAVYMTRQLPGLPAAFSNPTLTVHLNFQFRR